MAGDILLTSNVFSDDRLGLKQSNLIRRVTGGQFSHALICSSPPVFVEAIGTGVSTLSLARCFAHDVGNVRLLRYPDADVARKAAQLAQYEIGRDYSVARAVRSVFPLDILDRVEDHGIFCSALVAQVFVAAGASQFQRTPVDRTTPASLNEIDGLIDLTSSVFRSGMIPNNAETMSALDGDRAPTLSARQTELSAQCARALWGRVEALVTAYPQEQLSAQPTFYSILKLVTDAIDLIDSVPPSRRQVFARDVSALDTDLAEFMKNGDLAALLVEIESGDSRTIMRAIAESFEEKPDIELEALQGYLRAGVRQLADRTAAIANWEKWGPGRSAALSAYLPIDRAAAEATQRRNDALREILVRNSRPTD